MWQSEWKTDYEIGHPRLDFEHRIFLNLILEIEADLAKEKPIETIQRRLTEIYKYADFHFFSEESIMFEFNYPEIERHQKIHQQLLDEMRNYITSISIDLIRKNDLVCFLVHWFIHHTAIEDLKLALFVRAANEHAQEMSSSESGG